MKKLATFIFISILILLALPSSSYAQVNIISDPTHADYAVSYGLNQTIVFAGHPNNPEQIIDVCNKAEVCVIRGHAYWIYGNEMATNPIEAARVWSDALAVIAAGTSSQVYFQPWNEPTSVHPECAPICQGTETTNPQKCLTQCMKKINQFINALTIPSGIKLTTPAIDPHNQQNTAAEMLRLLGNLHRFDTYTANAYSPGKVDEVLANYGDKPIIFTETGILVNGVPTYEEMPLCRDMYCTGGTIEKLQNNSVGYALFSYGPDGIQWNLWQAECVIDALKGICNCETCGDETVSGPKALAKEIFNRSGGQTPKLDNAKVGRNWPAGPTTMESGKDGGIPTLLKLLKKLLNIEKEPVKDLFRPMVSGNTFRGPISRIVNWLIKKITGDNFQLGSQDLVPSDRAGRYPGEDYYVQQIIETGKLELPGTTAQICLPPRDITYTFEYFPDFADRQEVKKIVDNLFNQTSIHEQIATTLQVYAKMRQWVTGSAYSDYLEPVENMHTAEGKKELAYRSLTDLFRAGYMSKRIPAAKVETVYNFGTSGDGGLKRLLASADPQADFAPQNNPDDITSGIPVGDKPLARTDDETGDPVTEDFFNNLTADNRVDREGATEFKPSALVCCNPEHVESLGLDYNKVCKGFSPNDPDDWLCNSAGGLINEWPYEPYYTGKFVSDSSISEADWPIYFEQCFVAKKEDCENAKNDPTKEVYSGLFIDLSDTQRGRVYAPATWDDIAPQNSFLTEHKGECLDCQINKLFIPQGLGALDACRELASTSLPTSMYQQMINNNFPKKKDFNCDVGNLPYAVGPETNTDNANYMNFQKTWKDPRFHAFNTTYTIDDICEVEKIYGDPEPIGTGETDPETGNVIMVRPEATNRCTSQYTVKSYMHLYVPHYEKLQLCTDLLFGLLPSGIAGNLERELENMNENKLDARNLLTRTKVNNPGGVSSGLDKTGDIFEDYQKTPGKIWGRADINQGEEVYLPGGGTDAGLSASQKMYIPGSLQNYWFSGRSRARSSGENREYYEYIDSQTNWNLEPSDLLGSGPALSETINQLREIAQERGIPEELLLAKFWIEGGYFWDGDQLWCPASKPNCHGSNVVMYWIGLQHYLPNGKVVESYSGAHGLAQIYVPIHDEYDVDRATADWEYNARYGADYLLRMYEYYGSWANAVRRYHSPSEAEKGLNLVKNFLANPPINPETGEPAWNAWSTGRIMSVLGD